MLIAAAQPLFAWDGLEDGPSLKTINDLLAVLPDGALLEGLRQHRGRSRNDYPVHVAWGVVVLRVALRHEQVSPVLAALKRNAALRQLIGAERESDVPDECNMTRYLPVLGEEPHRTQLQQRFCVILSHKNKPPFATLGKLRNARQRTGAVATTGFQSQRQAFLLGEESDNSSSAIQHGEIAGHRDRRRIKRKRILVLAIVFSGCCVSTLAADRPNVLLIMVDDLRDYGGAFNASLRPKLPYSATTSTRSGVL